jgi:Xaa-Pro aminopeptidase
VTPEQRLKRTEWMIARLAVLGRKARSDWRQRVDILINMHERNVEASRVASQETKEKIDILINTQMQTGEQLRKNGEQQRKTDEQLRKTDEQIERLAVRHELEMGELRKAQELTDKALRAFIDSLRKGGNGNSPGYSQ